MNGQRRFVIRIDLERPGAIHLDWIVIRIGNNGINIIGSSRYAGGIPSVGRIRTFGEILYDQGPIESNVVTS
jgi:hypothetical protein